MLFFNSHVRKTYKSTLVLHSKFTFLPKIEIVGIWIKNIAGHVLVQQKKPPMANQYIVIVQ